MRPTARKTLKIIDLPPPTVELRLRMSQVAEREGLSRARVTQNMDLLKLNKDIRDYLNNLTCRKKMRFFSERRMRPLTRLHQSEQSRKFNEMVKVCDEKFGERGVE